MVDGNTNNQSEQLQLILLNNALDFVLSAAEAVRRDEGHRSLKEAVLHLGNGVELLVKARLAREHWSLIFSNVNQASYKELTKADFSSVDFPTARNRLEQIAAVTIEKSVIDHVDRLRKLRNQLTHFTATLDSIQTKSLVAKALAFCVKFCEQQDMVSPDSESKLGEIHRNLAEIQEFVDERMSTISREWREALVWECPECWQTALVIDGGEVHCKFCRQEADPVELAVTESGASVDNCPECGEESTFAFTLYGTYIGVWVCFSCGVKSENYDRCFRCDQVAYTPDPGEVFYCENCWDHILSRE